MLLVMNVNSVPSDSPHMVYPLQVLNNAQFAIRDITKMAKSVHLVHFHLQR